MFDRLKAHPVFIMRHRLSVEEAIQDFVTASEGAQPVRWLQFPSAVLLCVTATNDPSSGTFFVLDRTRGVWLWIYFEEDPYRSYGGHDFDQLVQEYDFLSLVERPSLLMAASGWVLAPGRPAEMAANG